MKTLESVGKDARGGQHLKGEARNLGEQRRGAKKLRGVKFHSTKPTGQGATDRELRRRRVGAENGAPLNTRSGEGRLAQARKRSEGNHGAAR